MRLTKKFCTDSADDSDEIICDQGHLSSSEYSTLPPPCNKRRLASPIAHQDHTGRDNYPIELSSSDDDFISLPPVSFGYSSKSQDTQPCTSTVNVSGMGQTKESIIEMFPCIAKKSIIDALFDIEMGNSLAVVDVLLNPPLLATILERMKSQIEEDQVRLSLDESDEEDMLFSVLEFYKSPSFAPKLKLKVRFRGQPGVDVGGVRRQMFTNVFTEFISSNRISLFYQGKFNLIIRYSVQNVLSGLMTILGRLIAHATVLEGIVFPYLSKASFWCLATGDDNAVLGFATSDDVEPSTKEMLNQVIFILVCVPMYYIITPCACAARGRVIVLSVGRSVCLFVCLFVCTKSGL